MTYRTAALPLLLAGLALLGSCGSADSSAEARSAVDPGHSTFFAALERRGIDHPAEALAEANAFRADQEASLDTGSELRLQTIMAEIRLQLGHGEDSLADLHAVIERGRETCDRQHLSRALLSLAAIKRHKGELVEARQDLEACQDLAGPLAEGDLGGLIAKRLAIVSAIQGRFAEAMEEFQRSEQCYRDAGNEPERLNALCNIAYTHQSMGNPGEARSSMEDLLPLMEEQGTPLGLGGLWANFALVCSQQGDHTSAMEARQRAIEIATRHGFEPLLAATLTSTINSCTNRGEFEDAVSLSHEAIKSARRLTNPRIEGISRVCLGYALRAAGDLGAALEETLRGVAILERISARVELAESLLPLYQLQRDLGRTEEALATLERQKKLQEQVLDEAARRRVQELDARFEASERERQIAVLEREQQVSELELANQRTVRLLMIAGFALVCLAGLFLLHRFRVRAREQLMLATIASEQQVTGQMREIDKLKDAFLANTSHELRAPLMGITGIAQSLVEGSAGELPREAHAHLELIQASGQRLGALVENILDFSELQREGSAFVRAPVEFRALTDVVLTLARPLIGGKDLHLVNAVEPSLPRVRADEDRIQQVLLNLVGNAIKFSDHGAIEVSAQVIESELVTQVLDHGRGIEPHELELVFQSHEQGSEGVACESRGMGLGLAISRYLVELHGGRIWAESNSGRGSTFSFALPLDRDDLARESLDASVERPGETLHRCSEPATQSEASISGGSPAEAATILVVDDDQLVCRILESHLGAEGYRVLKASSGERGLVLLENEEIDLVVLDVMMPQMSGFEVCRRIRARRSLEEMPVLLMSGMTSGQDHVAGFREGANDYVDKPIDRGDLVARVRTHLKLLGMHRRQAEEVRILRGLLPICSYCRRIRDDQRQWVQLETYISQHSEAKFSHGICPDCFGEQFPGIQQPQ